MHDNRAYHCIKDWGICACNSAKFKENASITNKAFMKFMQQRLYNRPSHMAISWHGLPHLVFLEEALNALCEPFNRLILLCHHLVDVQTCAIHNNAMTLCILLDLMHQVA